MSAVADAATSWQPAPDVRALAEMIRRNRFMPAPPADAVFVGDGDFRAIGTEFLRHFVEIGGLQPQSRMLDIGSGIGRLALPLTQYLDPAEGSYLGVDPVRRGIEWSAATIGSVYPNFRFEHLDLRHALYNPVGRIDGRKVTLPAAAASVDFIAMVSVATHLPAAEIARYADEAARVLRPGGRLFLTAFVIDATWSKRPPSMRAALPFRRVGAGPEWQADPKHLLAAVGFDDGWLDRTFTERGFQLHRKVSGHWRGGSAEPYQDIFVFQMPEARP